MRFYSIFCRVSCQTQNFNNIFSEKNVFSRRIEPQFRSQKRQIWFKSLPPPQKRDWHLLVPSIFRFSKKREKRRKTKKTRENPGFFVGHLFWSQNLSDNANNDPSHKISPFPPFCEWFCAAKSLSEADGRQNVRRESISFTRNAKVHFHSKQNHSFYYTP